MKKRKEGWNPFRITLSVISPEVCACTDFGGFCILFSFYCYLNPDNDAGEDLLAAGQAQAHGSIGGIADGGKPLLLDLVPKQIGNLFHTVSGKELVRNTVANHLCECGGLFIVN